MKEMTMCWQAFLSGVFVGALAVVLVILVTIFVMAAKENDL
jgi:uncharacterized protein (DUF2062 family)